MSSRSRWPIVVGLAAALAAVVVGVPQPGCAEAPFDHGVVLRGDPTVTVTFQPAYGDPPVTPPAAPSAR